MDTIAINGTTRPGTGKKATKAARAEGQIPCVMYGGDKVIHFSATHKDFKPIVYTPQFKLAEITRRPVC